MRISSINNTSFKSILKPQRNINKPSFKGENEKVIMGGYTQPYCLIEKDNKDYTALELVQKEDGNTYFTRIACSKTPQGTNGCCYSVANPKIVYNPDLYWQYPQNEYKFFGKKDEAQALMDAMRLMQVVINSDEVAPKIEEKERLNQGIYDAMDYLRNEIE